jgi:hypothetical protein
MRTNFVLIDSENVKREYLEKLTHARRALTRFKPLRTDRHLKRRKNEIKLSAAARACFLT